MEESKETRSGVAPTTRRAERGVQQRWTHCQERLLWGIPWGTLLICCLLVGFYLYGQNGAERWGQPLVIPFTSWSYSHLLGVFLGPVSHTGPDHLFDNVVGLLVFGTIAEYVYGHFPVKKRDARRLWTAPYVRALVLFPGIVLLTGILGSVFSWGPTIGFSTVVYACAGVALVRFPFWTLVAVSVREALAVLVRAIDQPFVLATSSPATEPWFVDIAVQGHVFGLLLGVAVGTITIVVRNGDHATPWKLWIALVVFGLVESLWVVWWPAGTSYVLSRALGVVVVCYLATVVTVGVLLAGREDTGGTTSHAGIVVVLVPLAIMAGIAVPVNTAGNVTTPPGAETVDVHGYAVTYAEDVEHQRLAPFADITDTETATASGVVVVNRNRGIWTQAVDTSALESDGTARIRLGSVGWEQTVFAVRRGWQTAGGERAYHVSIHPRDGTLHRVYVSDPAKATPVVAGSNLTVVPDGRQFQMVVTRNNETIETAPVPDPKQSVTVDNLEVRREDDTLVAVANRTRVPIAWRE